MDNGLLWLVVLLESRYVYRLDWEDYAMLTPRLACYTLHKSDSPRAMWGRGEKGERPRLTFAYEILGALLTGKRTLTLLSLGVAALME